ncbi:MULTISPECIES: VWA domain-containing protein [Sorangium]|nr:VWA domain-containing protein [Sorangium cellulosum]
MRNRSAMVALAATGISVIFAACGGADGSSVSAGGAGGAGAGASSGTGPGNGSGNGSGTGGATSTGYGTDGPGEITTGPSSGAGEGAGGEASCAGETKTAELVPLDLYIMLDSSGSMRDRLATGGTKWTAVTDALEAFFTDPKSEGLGVGLQYFPLLNAGQPMSCRTNEECGVSGPCALRACQSSFDARTGIQICVADADCPDGDPCIDIGVCSQNSNVVCGDIGERCPNRAGTCNRVSRSTCAHPYSCVTEDYATPAVSIAPLDAAWADELIGSIDRTFPDGGTPTAGALSGAIAQARAHAQANPTHRVVTVLATDGMPTECNPTSADGIAEIAAEGLGGSPSISTFVIGVFGRDDDGAQATMNRIAEGGGTKSAYFIDTSSDVTQAFLDALSEIRGTSLACEYQVPAPSAGQTLDYGTLNVQHTPPEGADPSTIFYVASEARCDATAGGWYYDVDPATGGTPTKIVMCPATCTHFQAGGQVQLQVGCKTEIPPIN